MWNGGSIRVNIYGDGFTIQSISHLSQVTCTHQFPTKALCTAIMSSRNVEHVNPHQHKLIATYTVDNGRPTVSLRFITATEESFSKTELHLQCGDLYPHLVCNVET